MKKKRMMGWMFGIPLIVVLLIIIIRIEIGRASCRERVYVLV